MCFAGVLESSDDFESSDDIYDAIGGILEEAVGSKFENEIKWE